MTRANAVQIYLQAYGKGRKSTVKSIILEQVLSLSGNDLRRQVNRLRRQGVPIGSSRDGYFYAVNAGEVYATIRQLKSMSAGLEAAIQGLETALEHFGESGE